MIGQSHFTHSVIGSVPSHYFHTIRSLLLLLILHHSSHSIRTPLNSVAMMVSDMNLACRKADHGDDGVDMKPLRRGGVDGVCSRTASLSEAQKHTRSRATPHFVCQQNERRGRWPKISRSRTPRSSRNFSRNRARQPSPMKSVTALVKLLPFETMEVPV